MQDYIPRNIDINDSIGEIFVKQFDHRSRFIRLRIIDKDLGPDFPMYLEGCHARMYVRTGDDPGVLINGEVVSGDEGIVTFLLPNSVTQTVGSYPCEIRLTNPEDEALISTKVFKLTVEESIFNDDAFENDEELSVLQQALNTVDGFDNRIHALNKSVSRIIDGHAFVKPLWLGESVGFAAQGITYIADGRYLVTFNDLGDDDNTKLAVFDETSGFIAEIQAAYGHANSVAKDGSGVFYIPADDGLSVQRFTVLLEEEGETPELSITPLDPMTFATDVKVWSVFNCGGAVYAYGVKDSRPCVWELTVTQPAYLYIIFPSDTFVALPNEAPRTNQSWAADGTYLYWLRSNPNAVAVFDFASGQFIRWSGIGDFVGGSMSVGEVEMICFAEDEMKLISQYYYPNSQSNLKRFWLFSQLKWSRELPPEQQHWYPNEVRLIYVSNAYPDGIAVRTNLGDTYPRNEQTGTQNYPYPSLETALYAAMATPNNPIEIVMLDTGEDYEIDDLVLRVPSMGMVINCEGNVRFTFLHLATGNLSISGNCFFERIATTNRSRLQITGGTFTSKSRIDGAAPYSIAGTVSIINGMWFAPPAPDEEGDENEETETPADEILFEFASGANGVVGFNVSALDGEGNPLTDSEGGLLSSPRSNNSQQLDLTLYNVRNAGRRDRWTVVYAGEPAIQIGNAITTILSDFYVNDGTVFRVKWRAESGDYYNTIVHVNGDTIVDLSAIVDISGSTKYRVVKMRFRPRVYSSGTDDWVAGDMRVMSVTDYSVSGGAIVSAATNSGNLPAGVEIAEIAVCGY